MKTSQLTFIDKKFNYCLNRVYNDPISMNEVVLLHYVGGKNKKEMFKINV